MSSTAAFAFGLFIDFMTFMAGAFGLFIDFIAFMAGAFGLFIDFIAFGLFIDFIVLPAIREMEQGQNWSNGRVLANLSPNAMQIMKKATG